MCWAGFEDLRPKAAFPRGTPREGSRSLSPLSSSSNQSTTPVILFTFTADGGDGADYAGGNSGDAERDDANNEGDQHANNVKCSVSPANSNPGIDGRRLVCASCRCHFHFNYSTSTRLQTENLHRLINWRCRFCNSRPYLVQSHPGGELRLDMQYRGSKQDQLVILLWNVNGILRELAALE